MRESGGADSSVWYEHRLRKAIIWSEFKTWLLNKFSKTYASNIYRYSRKYSHLLTGNLRDLDLLSPYLRDHVVKTLTNLAKYVGTCQEFKKRLRDYGVKTFRPNAFASFLRILNSDNNSDLLTWYRKAINVLRTNERLLLRCAAVTGLRKNEAIQSFNLIIELCENADLQNYYNEELDCLQRFKFKKQFLRRTKNGYISFVPESLILEVAKSRPVAYAVIIKRLKRKNLRTRIIELRDYYGTFLVRHGLTREEVDLLQGRIPPNIFIRQYWSPSFKELRDRTLKAVADLDKTL